MKPKPIVYIVAFLFLSSCSRSIYYAFEEKGTYCTLEEKKNGTVIYRAVSKEHYKKSSSSINYLHIYSPYSSYELYTGIGNNFFLTYIQNNELKDKKICRDTFVPAPYQNFLHYLKKNEDSLKLLSDIENDLKNQSCFAEHKITWFPPYLKKIKKIDYKKFNLPLKEKYLKTMADKDK
ncbi:hypothetical protein ACSTS3_18115 [Aquimarina muelleri]|uniref:hypothetical protein n=1 Tax=Aquimarina muelleri TaxID=279356 RepID=UPI003F682823